MQQWLTPGAAFDRLPRSVSYAHAGHASQIQGSLGGRDRAFAASWHAVARSVDRDNATIARGRTG